MHPSERVWRERALLSAVLAGDARAWRTWYEESFAALQAYVLWRCAGLRDLADEVVQETWLTAVRRIRCFDPDQGSFAAWLNGIAVNVLRNHFHRQERRGRSHTVNNGRPATDESPDAALLRREMAERVVAALAELPERYELVLRGKYFEQHTVEDLAAERGETPKAIESLLSRARQAFREAYLRLEHDHE
jgi:RNA polymerase sigma-70 factor (ECF subfamily)